MGSAIRTDKEAGKGKARVGAFEVGTIAINLDAKHGGAHLPVEADYTAGERTGRANIVAKDRRAVSVGYMCFSPSRTRLVANVHAVPGKRRGADKGWRRPIRAGYTGGRDQSKDQCCSEQKTRDI
jgi:hypothetical protein